MATKRTIWIGAQTDIVDVGTLNDSLVALVVNGDVLVLSADEAARIAAALVECANEVR